jgi:hypothetical protein
VRAFVVETFEAKHSKLTLSDVARAALLACGGAPAMLVRLG